MKFFDRLWGFCYDKPGDGGGGAAAKTPEQITREKLGEGGSGGGGEDDSPKPSGGDGGSGEDPGGEPSDGGGDSEGSPTGEESPSGGGEDPGEEPSGKESGGEGGEGADDGDEDGGDDDTPFYDPEVHVEGKPAHSNTFPTREKAEFAAIEKAQMLKDKLEEMKEDDVDPGAVRLPSALQGDPKNLDKMLSYENVHNMDADELRDFLNESDGSRQRLDAKHNRTKESRQTRQYENDLEKAQGELFDGLREVMPVSEIQENIETFNDPDAARQLIETKIDEKVKEELSDERQELEDWIDKVDSGEIEMTFKEFDKEKQRRMEKIKDKRDEVREKYSGVLDTFDRVDELNSKVDQTTELSPEEKSARRWDAFDTMQHDLGKIPIEETGNPDLDILADTPAARAELVSAKNWAVQNADDYNGLLHPRDWREALEVGWPKHKEDVRADRQREALEGDRTKGGGGGDPDDDDIPKPDKSKLDVEGDNVHDMNRKSLDKLEELTNAAT